MKRFVALLILLFMLSYFVVPILNINNEVQYEEKVVVEEVEPVLLSDVTYEIVFEEVIEVKDPYEFAIQKMQEKMKKIDYIEDRKKWFLAYKNIISEYTEWIDPPETIYDYFTEDEIILICRVVETETYQCDFDSKVNVANVVLNRIESGEFGNTVEEVITTEKQFVYGRKTLTEDTILAVEYAFMMEDTTHGALFFHSNRKTDKFCGNDFIFQDKAGHNFY